MADQKHPSDFEGRGDRIRGRLDALRTPARAPLRELNPHVQKNHTLLYDFEDSTRGSRRSPWVLIAAVGGVAAVGLVLLAVAFGGGGNPAPSGSAGPAGANPPPIEHGQGILGLPAASASASGSTPSAERSPTPTSEPGTAAEGATRASSLGAVSLTSVVPFASPIRGVGRVVDGFGTPRGEGYVHAGVDVAPAGGGTAQVIAACDGPVVGVDTLDGYGNFLAIDCGGGWRTVYAQLAQVSVKPGDTVHIGETKLGTATAPLHFEIRFNGVPTDPAKLIDVTTLPSPTPTPSATTTSTPTKSTASPGATPTPPPATTNAPSEATATPAPSGPTATPTPAPPTATPTMTPRPPTPTPTIRVIPPTPTPRPVIQ